MLINKGTVTLNTNRLILRRFTPDDAQEAFNNWTCDSEVTRFMRWQAHSEPEQTQTFLSKVIAGYGDPKKYHWAVELKEIGQVIGSISLMVENETDEKGEIGYCIGKSFWGRGLMAEALRAVIKFAVEECGFNRLEAVHSIRNPASGRVMQKAGMLFEGRARQLYKSREGFEDCDIYYILKEDYAAKEDSRI